MAVATYATDLALIDDAEDVGIFAALGGGGAGLSDETDYYIEGTQSVSKAGFTASTRGFIMDTGGTITVAAGDAIFVWGKQNNRNLMDTFAAHGMAVLVGDDVSNYDHFTVDGNDTEGSSLAGWRNYAVDPTQTPTSSTGTPTTTDYVGFMWVMNGSGSLKGNPNAQDISRHGRELQIIDGQAAAYGTFDAAGVDDSASAWGIITPSLGSYLFHGAFVMGTVATAVDFRDSGRVINVLEDVFLPTGFNEFEIRNASSNVEWTNIIISHLGAASFPAVLTLDVGTFTGSLCQFNDCATTTFASTGACTNSTWTSCDQIILGEADISGSSILTSTVAADTGAVLDDRTTTATTPITELSGCTFSQGTNAHHAIDFGTGVDDDISLEGIAFNGFDDTSGEDQPGAALRFLATGGSLTCSVTNCTVDGVPATASNFFKDDAAGIAVTLVFDTITLQVTVLDATDDTPLTTAHVQLLKDSDKSVLLSGAVNGSGVISTSIPYDADTNVVGWAREHNMSGVDYTQQDFSGEYTINGFFITIRLVPAE
jgi:hypothetical protein